LRRRKGVAMTEEGGLRVDCRQRQHGSHGPDEIRELRCDQRRVRVAHRAGWPDGVHATELIDADDVRDDPSRSREPDDSQRLYRDNARECERDDLPVALATRQVTEDARELTARVL